MHFKHLLPFTVPHPSFLTSLFSAGQGFALTLLLILQSAVLPAQEATDAQYQAAMQAIEVEATYLISTKYNGTTYYLDNYGNLVQTTSEAGSFTFHKTEGQNLFKSPGWQFDQYFTNPYVSDNGNGDIWHFGYIRTDASNARIDWEGQVWYKQDDLYAVRATNAVADTWGANTYWTVMNDPFNDNYLPMADYSLTPDFRWQLTKISDGPDPGEDPSLKDVARLTNLPHIYIDTFTGRNITSKTNYVYARLWYVDEDDNVAFHDSLQIRGRGNSTWSLAKKPYKLKFNKKVKWLGKGYANTKKWVLLANHGDKTLIRNAVTSLMGERAGLKFNPAAKFADLTLNGEYVGTYQISDGVDVRPHRVNITEQDLPLTEESNITGGYLLEVDGFKDFTSGLDGFYSSHNVPIRIHYPDEDDIASEQYDYISTFVNSFESRLFSNQFDDPVEGYRTLVDSTSLAAWYLCTELSGNVDGFFSAYFYKEKDDDHFFFGPLWDYDIAYNNDSRTDRNNTSNTTQQLMAEVGYGNGNGCRSWAMRMWKDPWFGQLVNRSYAQLINGGIENYLYDKIDSLVQLTEQSRDLNYQRWGINTKTLRERVLYSTYDNYVTDLKDYIHNHAAYLTTAFAQKAVGGYTPTPDPDPEPQPEPQPITPDFAAVPHYYYTITNAGSGTLIDVNAEDDLVVGNPRDEESESQQWQMKLLESGYYQLLNRATGMALTDPTPQPSTATTNTGAQLSLTTPDTTDTRQHWNLVAQSDGRYNLNNRASDHTANLSGGSSSAGTSILSYTNDSRNASSNNRQWFINYADSIATEPEPEPIPDAINETEEMDYALAYDAQTQRLHFGADQLEALRFVVRVYDQAGRNVRTFRASEGSSLQGLPRGLYIITWTPSDGRRRTVKFTKD